MNRQFWMLAGIGVSAVFGYFAYRRYLESIETTEPVDEVDLASEESFPASDAPSWTPVHGVGKFDD